MEISQLTPEFAVRDIAKSLAFYRDLLGFKLEYERPEEGFALVSLGAAQLMLDQISLGRTFGTELQNQQLGLGLNLQILVSEAQLKHMHTVLADAEYALYLQLEEKSYRTGQTLVRQKQFVVADPDGYLVRIAAKLNHRDS